MPGPYRRETMRVGYLETGKQQRADFAVLERLARALDVQIGDPLVLEPKKRRR